MSEHVCLTNDSSYNQLAETYDARAFSCNTSIGLGMYIVLCAIIYYDYIRVGVRVLLTPAHWALGHRHMTIVEARVVHGVSTWPSWNEARSVAQDIEAHATLVGVGNEQRCHPQLRKWQQQKKRETGEKLN